jgi:hypothetical protein
MTGRNLTDGQIAAIETLARDLWIIEPQDRMPAILMMVDEYTKNFAQSIRTCRRTRLKAPYFGLAT